MGKSKKTRWRTFEIAGSQDETQTNGADVKANGTELDSHTSATSQKYSQILGDLHTNSSTQHTRSSSHHQYKSRAYNNKENFYNQRNGGRPGVQRSWQRGGNYRTPLFNGKDRRSDENEKPLADGKVDSTAEPIKFNEDEYTRITTPRQDVLFKKGYLSRMNNKTATILSAPVNSTDSTAASSTITNSDPDSSVSTLSPATTPSMDFNGQSDPMDFPPMYYPGYYDENGMLVIPMYNGYNYYPPNGSSATSPVYLMPYPPYQYDPFFMTPGGMPATDGDENETAEDKTESDGATKDNNNQNAENQNGARSSDEGAGSTHGEEPTKDEKKDSTELNGNQDINDSSLSTSDPKTSFPIYPNELNGYMYPAYSNGYYNNFYYFNGGQAQRPPKMKRRKRFLNSRNSHNSQPRSADTTTDYSDEENNTTHQKRFTPRYQNGWTPHHNGFNHFNDRFQRIQIDQNGNQEPKEIHLNADVQEFYPRSQSTTPNVNCDDIERIETEPLPKPKVEAPKATKASHATKSSAGRVSKKEIIEGIKSMEQQNIDLMATKIHTTVNMSQDDEWNVIKKGKKVKVVKDIKIELTSSDVREAKVEEKVEEIKIEEPKQEVASVKKPSPPAPMKSKKSKGKNKKKKSHLMVKQDGFEIIEPEFTNSSITEPAQDELSEDETIAESEIPVEEPEVVEIVVLEKIEAMIEPVVVVEQESAVELVEAEERVAQMPETVVEEVKPEVNDLPVTMKHVVVVDEDDAVIDISDEDICGKESIPIEMPIVKEVKHVVEAAVEPKKIQVQAKPEVEVKKPQIQLKLEVTKKPEVIDPFQDPFFNDRTNIAALERDLMENLRLLDDEIELKSPIINPLHDFPITSAVQKWLQTKQCESFDNLFHVQNFKKLSEQFDDDDDDDVDETESDISEKELKSETDSDYASDFQAKANGSPTCSTQAKASSEKSTKCNKLIAKESFCALM